MNYLIKNVEIYDPESNSYKKEDLYINKGKIEKIAKDLNLPSEKIIKGEGLTLVPGFIDIHTHEDPIEKDSQVRFHTQEAMLNMGVTTVVGGNCGFSPKDISEYFGYIDQYGSPINILLYGGYNYIRSTLSPSSSKSGSSYKLGDVHKILSPGEIEKLNPLVKQFMDQGALGLSFGLEYSPGTTTEEVIQVINMLKPYENSLAAAHYRYDNKRSLEAINECIHIAKTTGLPFIFSHIGSCSAFGYMEESLKLLSGAIGDGVDIIADCYPYNAFSTRIGSTVFDDGCFESWGKGVESIFVTEGKYKNHYCTEEIFDYLREYEPDAYVVAFVMDQDEVNLALKDPNVMIASDGNLTNGQGHPRGAGTFPRVLGKISREEEILSFEEAIRKMTLMPANKLGFSSKGRIKVGCDADITILNKKTIIDKASYDNPTKAPEGIEYVFVNGELVLEGGKIINKTSGKAIRRQEIN